MLEDKDYIFSKKNRKRRLSSNDIISKSASQYSSWDEVPLTIFLTSMYLYKIRLTKNNLETFIWFFCTNKLIIRKKTDI